MLSLEILLRRFLNLIDGHTFDSGNIVEKLFVISEENFVVRESLGTAVQFTQLVDILHQIIVFCFFEFLLADFSRLQHLNFHVDEFLRRSGIHTRLQIHVDRALAGEKFVMTRGIHGRRDLIFVHELAMQPARITLAENDRDEIERVGVFARRRRRKISARNNRRLHVLRDSFLLRLRLIPLFRK